MQKIVNPVEFIREVIKSIKGISSSEIILVSIMAIVLAGIMLGMLGMQESVRSHSDTRVELHNIPVHFEIDETPLTKYAPREEAPAVNAADSAAKEKAPTEKKRELYYDELHKDWRYR